MDEIQKEDILLEKEEQIWLEKSLKIYKNALRIAVEHENKEKIEEYKEEIEKIRKQLKESGISFGPL